MKPYLVIFICILGFFSCEDYSTSSTVDAEEFNQDSRGIGFFDYNGYSPFADKTIRVYYYIPENVDNTTDILFIFHGNGRNAKEYRNAMISKAEAYNFIIITPKFSSEYFPGGDMYNLGNVFADGDNPSESTLNPEEQWTFSVIEPIFDHVKDKLNNTTASYHVFGHSAGGQVAHRFLFFKPHARINKMVASASGWYTVTDTSISFPYGFDNCPLEQSVLPELFQKELTIIVGDLDNDPNAPALRRNAFADAQGTNRLDRAIHFYNTAENLAEENNAMFNWDLRILENVDHDFLKTSLTAADIIFN